MNKKLPNVFANKNTGIINNNVKTYYSKDAISPMEDKLVDDNIKSIIVKKKINDLFGGNFIYKAKAIVTTKEGDKEEVIIARNNDTLLTINNESIKIKDIIDIKKI